MPLWALFCGQPVAVLEPGSCSCCWVPEGMRCGWVRGYRLSSRKWDSGQSDQPLHYCTISTGCSQGVTRDAREHYQHKFTVSLFCSKLLYMDSLRANISVRRPKIMQFILEKGL